LVIILLLLLVLLLVIILLLLVVLLLVIFLLLLIFLLLILLLLLVLLLLILVVLLVRILFLLWGWLVGFGLASSGRGFLQGLGGGSLCGFRSLAEVRQHGLGYHGPVHRTMGQSYGLR